MLDGILTLDLALRILLAIALGGAIGLERQWGVPRATGIRTNALVAVGSALFVIVGADGLSGGVGADPTRVAAQIVSGIGFLGAGVIIRDGFNIRGLTTAATLWCAAAVGSLAGAGLPWLALIGATAVVGTNVLLRPLGKLVNRRTQNSFDGDTDDDISMHVYSVEATTNERSEQRIRALLLGEISRPDIVLRSLRVTTKSGARLLIRAVVSVPSDVEALEEAVARIAMDPEVSSSRWREVADPFE